MGNVVGLRGEAQTGDKPFFHDLPARLRELADALEENRLEMPTVNVVVMLDHGDVGVSYSAIGPDTGHSFYVIGLIESIKQTIMQDD